QGAPLEPRSFGQLHGGLHGRVEAIELTLSRICQNSEHKCRSPEQQDRLDAGRNEPTMNQPKRSGERTDEGRQDVTLEESSAPAPWIAKPRPAAKRSAQERARRENAKQAEKQGLAEPLVRSDQGPFRSPPEQESGHSDDGADAHEHIEDARSRPFQAIK